MLDGDDQSAMTIANGWLDRFQATMAGDPARLADLFVEDCHWRDLVALTGVLRTFSGPEAPLRLAAGLRDNGAGPLHLHPTIVRPQFAERAGRKVLEAGIVFEAERGHCEGVIRLLPDEHPVKAWTIMTALDRLKGEERPEPPAYAKDVRAPNWADERAAARAYADRDPEVLVVGGGHAGLTIAARLGALGIDTLVVDREKRIGDNWRLRYHNLKLHNQIGVNHMPYLPFPETWPRYIPKDMIANWLEFYTEALEINFWTETSFEAGDWPGDGAWRVRLRLQDGSERVMRPKHIVMACSVSAVPKWPDIPSLDAYQGPKLHAAEFEIGAEWQGLPVMVFGTGTSAHDIAQHLHAHGAQVTMVQRSPTMVVNVEPSAQIYDGLYLGDGPPIEERDLLNVSVPYDLMIKSHQIVTEKVKELDRETLEGLERIGFRLDYGEDNTGWPLKYRTRGGGYYFNIGCSELLIAGEIDLIQYQDIETFVADGVRMTDGTKLPADLMVFATGYEGQGYLLRELFGEEIAERTGQVWGFDAHKEMAGMWTRTGQPGLWFTAGAFSQCRIFGKYLALQIALDLRWR